ncbi:hypothetical protein Calag_1147 [Caldisphaera lagunensis DSM 15908]|uniref:Dihydropteroate synthase-like enzyme n=1 Tax=Caldisphaera lagunensis (strain DSM 15908 / JCM 11604 / ANMR 0165 / IC-154) TaxID=1056495 RepID=L0ABR6_CALLD|nr:hypothetical protein [Caldisphaera lagunensis]AFZ70869.1 hypothetical protein Calag_1147 [Caldisphaera lagunensis DSM 15908]
MKNKKKVLLLTTNKKFIKIPSKKLVSFDILEIKDLYNMNLDQIVNILSNIMDKYDNIILPGNIIWDFSDFNGKIIKGTEFYNYLFDLLNYVEIEKLSPKVSADKLFPEQIKKIVEKKKKAYKKPIFKIRDLKIYKRYPIRLFTEIFLHKEERMNDLMKVIKSYIQDGADTIILGVFPSIQYEYLKDVIHNIRELSSIPIGLDANIDILKNFKNDVDILMSFTINNIYENIDWIFDRVSVLLINDINHDMIKKIRDLKRKGIKLILDPIAYPAIYPGFFNTLIRAKKLSNLGLPIMIGINNVTELMDADTTGTNAFATFLSIESGASIILTGEVSVKNRGSVFEVKNAINMAEESIILKKPPKDLSLNLLGLKEKKFLENDIKIYGNRDNIYIEISGKTKEISCKDNCPLSKLYDLDKEDLAKLSILIYRYCSPWSIIWNC